MGLGQLRDFLHSEGERIQMEISGYLQLNHLAIDSTKSIVGNIVQWKKAAPSISRSSERNNFAGPTIPPPPSSTVAKSLSRRNDLSPVVGGVRGGTGQHFAQHVPIAEFTLVPPESRVRESRNSVAPRSPPALSTAQAWTVVQAWLKRKS